MDLSEITKVEQLGFDRWFAIGKKLGGIENIKGILRDEKTVEIKDVIQMLFDKHGRRIPKDLQSNVCDANRDFRLYGPMLENEDHYADRIMRLHESLRVYTEITAKQFLGETQRLLALIRDNSQIAKIAKGVWLPVVLPKLISPDFGAELEHYLKGVGKGYAKTFNDRKFYNHRKGTLAGKVGIGDGSRHDQLIERMKQGPVLGIHFPNPLQGFSINASREQMATLPEGFILSGLDTAIAMIMYPDILARDHSTPNLNIAALAWRFTDYSLQFFRVDSSYLADDDDLADDDLIEDNLVLDLNGNIIDAADDYSNGLLFLG